MAKQAYVQIIITGLGKPININNIVTNEPVFNQLTLVQHIDWHHSFELRLPTKIEKEKKLLNQFEEYIGKNITICITSIKPEKADKKLDFKGIITEVNISSYNANYEIIVRGQSPTILLSSGSNSCSFTKKTLQHIADKVVKDAVGASKIAFKPEPKYTKPIPYITQYKESAFHFLNRIAAIYGEWCYFNGRKLCFGALQKEKPKKVYYGGSGQKSDNGNEKPDDRLISFDISAKLLPTNLKATWHNYIENKNHDSQAKSAVLEGLNKNSFVGKILEKSESIFEFEPIDSFTQHIEQKKDLDEFIKRRKNMQANDMLIFTGTSSLAELNLCDIIHVFDKKNNIDYGKYIIIGISHSADGLGNYQNHFEAIPEEAKFPPLNPHVKQPFAETQTALVKEDKDPDKIGRVKVQFYWQKNPELSPWIRAISKHSKKSNHVYFCPEKDDEVLVGFEHGNPDKPHILGTLYHGKAKPDPHIRYMKTSGGNHIFMTDKEGEEEIRIENKDGENKLVLTLGEGGKITIEAKNLLELKAKDITITAEKSLKLDAKDIDILANNELMAAAQSKATLEGQQEVAVGGLKVGVTASTQLKLEGSAMTEIKGGVIKLN